MGIKTKNVLAPGPNRKEGNDMNSELKRKLLLTIRAPKRGKRNTFIMLRVSGEQKAEIQKTANKLRCNVSRYLLGLHEVFDE